MRKPSRVVTTDNLTIKIFEPDHPNPCFHSKADNIRLYCGDSFCLLRQCNSETFDLIFADPPYFLSSGGITCSSGLVSCVDKGEWDKSRPFEAVHLFNYLWLQECKRILKSNGTIFITGTMHNIFSVGYALQCLGFHIVNDIIWHKINPPPNMSRRCFVHSTETILWAKKHKNAKHYFNYELMREIGDPIPGKQMQSLWHIEPPKLYEKRYGKHPTQKPEELLTRIILSASKPGEMILDPFCGSGTTGVVAARYKRYFVGFEQLPEYNKIAIKRIQEELKLIDEGRNCKSY